MRKPSMREHTLISSLGLAKNNLMTPSQALNKTFDLPDEPLLPLEEAPTANVVRSLHAFTVGNVGFLLPAETVSELFYDLAYCRLPNTPPTLLGMANVRGDIIPLFDLNELFGIAADPNVHWHVLVIGNGEEAVGIRVTNLPTRVMLSAQNRLKTLPPLPENLRPYIRACYQLDGIWVDWDITACLTHSVK
jgi:chemotaxis signal transduction protein